MLWGLLAALILVVFLVEDARKNMKQFAKERKIQETKQRRDIHE